MSDTQGLKTRVEDEVRAKLAEMFGKKFGKGKLPVGTKSADGKTAYREFDAISSDESIVASIKAGSWLTSGGNIPAAKIHAYYEELYFFTLIGPRAKKLLVFTEAGSHKGFAENCDGKKPADVEIRHIPLDPETQRFADGIRRAASEEIRAKNTRGN